MIASKKEIIEYKHNLPFKCHSEKLHNTRRHYHSEITLLLILDGNCTIFVDGEEFDLKTDDLFLINTNSVHEAYTTNGNAIGIILQFDPKKTYIDTNIRFDNLLNSQNEEAIEKIKLLIVKIYKNYVENRNFFSVQHLHEIISYLFLYFRDLNVDTKKNNKQEKRIESIANYIEENFNKRITLQELADNEGLSISYLSNFFEKWFGKTFLNYYNDVRIDHAIEDILNTDLSIEQISYNNGYDDPRSFVAAFKKRYHSLPSEYRKNVKNSYSKFKPSFEAKEESDEIIKIKKLLEKYNLTNTHPKTIEIEKVRASEVIEINDINVKKIGTKFENIFTKQIGVVSAHDMLLGDVQQMLIRAKKEIGYEYVKFHGILSDDMELYFEDEDGSPQYNFFLIDKILDFIVSIQMKPQIELTFMPKALALDSEHYLFNGKYLASEPKDIKKWCSLIENLFDHIISKYGEHEVEKWEFSVWNMPDTGPELYGFSSDEVFFDMYKKTYDIIKDFIPNVKILSPAIGMQYDKENHFLNKFIKYCKENDCLPDEMNFLFTNDLFTNDVVKSNRDKYTLSTRSLLSKDENYFAKTLEIYKKYLSNKELELPIQISSWMLTCSHRNLISDTCYKSCYYVKNYLENYDQANRLAYWCLTDLNGESPLGNKMFYGGLGLFTRRSIEKSTYNALQLLAKLDNEVIYKGKGYFITKSHKKIHVILYNYIHYSDLYADGKIILESNDRYTPFNMAKIQKYILNFENIKSDKVFIKEYSVGCQHGSSFDAYLRMGGIELKYDDEFEHLKRHSSYYIEIEERTVSGGKLQIEKNVNALEVKLIEIKLQ